MYNVHVMWVDIHLCGPQYDLCMCVCVHVCGCACMLVLRCLWVFAWVSVFFVGRRLGVCVFLYDVCVLCMPACVCVFVCPSDCVSVCVGSDHVCSYKCAWVSSCMCVCVWCVHACA